MINEEDVTKNLNTSDQMGHHGSKTKDCSKLHIYGRIFSLYH